MATFLKRFSLCIVFCFLSIFSVSNTVFAETYDESIKSFDTVITVNEDSSIKVTEDITYDFGSNEKHGIYRDVLLDKNTGTGAKKIKVNIESVTDDKGESYIYEISNEYNDGNYKRVKIGNAGILITGEHRYIIKYTVDRALDYYNDFDEIYWNSTGNGWEVPIEKATTLINLPKEIDVNLIRHACYIGSIGSTEKCDSDLFIGSTTKSVSFALGAERALSPYEGMTVAVGFPKGIVIEPTAWEFFLQSINWSYLFLILPVGVFIYMFRKWYKYGRDPKTGRTIIAEYDVPDGLTPLEVSAVLKEKISGTDISAEIISLAIKGYIKIERIEEKGFFGTTTDYILKKIKEDDPSNEADKKLLTALFNGKTDKVKGVKISDLMNVFYTNVPKITEKTFSRVVEGGYMKENPQKVQIFYLSISIVAFVLAMTVGIALVSISDFVPFVSMIASAFIIGIIGYFMPVKTEKGVLTKEHILGLKEYLQIAEKDRINFHNAPEKKPEIFEKFLPFAMVFGVEKAWAKEFENIYIQQPNWYSDPYSSNFNAVIFANSLHNFSTASSSSMTSSPGGSGGGGSSGGGGGGGGGGSW